MFYIHVLKSKVDDKCYIGSTKDLKQRVRLHNAGRVYSTRLRKPLVLVYYEAFRVEKDARQREKMLKNYGQGIKNLYKRLTYSLDLEKGAG